MSCWLEIRILKEEKMRKILTVCIIMIFALCQVFGQGGKDDGASYPSKNIEMIVPYGAGGGTDNAARIIAEALSTELGRQVNVVNRAGAGGEIGFEEIATAEPDGYTIGILGGPDHSYLVNIKETNYSLDDFDNLAVYNLSLPVLVARKGSFSNWDELVEYAKANPGSVTIGCSGGGPITEAAIAMTCGDFDATIVKFSGSADVSSSLLGGHIDLACLTPSYLPTLEANGCVPLIYFSAEKVPGYEDIPSLAELGFDVDMAHNPIVALPTGCPDEVRATLMAALDKIGSDPQIKEKFENLNTVYSYKTGEELQKYLSDMDALIADMVVQYPTLFV